MPFHHSVVDEGGVSDVVLGYAHCGMVAAALWIAKLATPCLLKALEEHPDYNLKVKVLIWKLILFLGLVPYKNGSTELNVASSAKS